MPDPVATQLREAGKTAVTGLTTTGSRVYLGRHYPIDLSAGPSLAVHSTGQVITRGDVDTLDRLIDLMLIGMVSGSADFEDTLDAIAAEVETAILSDAGVAALVKDIWPSAIDIELAEDGETAIGRSEMTFTAHVVTPRGDPTLTA